MSFTIDCLRKNAELSRDQRERIDSLNLIGRKFPDIDSLELVLMVKDLSLDINEGKSPFDLTASAQEYKITMAGIVIAYIAARNTV